jgi:hypothetical protein
LWDFPQYTDSKRRNPYFIKSIKRHQTLLPAGLGKVVRCLHLNNRARTAGRLVRPAEEVFGSYKKAR